VSKRKIAKLIDEGIVKDWDDPRLFTLTALRRRGFPVEAINNFCAQLGLTGAQAVAEPSMLEASVRDVLNVTAPRVMVVLDPIKVTIVNLEEEAIIVTAPDFPAVETSTTHQIRLEKVIYIERDDFMESSSDKGYRRLTPQQSVGLKHAGLVLTVENVTKNADGVVSELQVKCAAADKAEKKPKAFIHWVSAPVTCEVRLYERLFNHKNPEDSAQVPGGFITDCNRDSLKTISNALADKSMLTVKPYDNFQFERIGFFSVDTDSTADHLVFNRTVTLREDKGKKA